MEALFPSSLQMVIHNFHVADFCWMGDYDLSLCKSFFGGKIF